MTERVWEFLATNSVLSCCYYSVSIQFFFNRDPSVALSVFEVLCNLRLLITRVSTKQNVVPVISVRSYVTLDLSVTLVKVYKLKTCPSYICEGYVTLDS